MQLDNLDNNNYCELVLDIYKAVGTTAYNMGVSEKVSADIARQVVITIQQYYRGQLVYVKQGDKGKISARNAKIMAEFTGDNFLELGIKYDRTPARIRQIVKE